VYKLHRALYGLKQAPRAWYECLKDFLLKNNFVMGKANSTLFSHKVDKDIFICQIYVDSIIFGSTDKNFCEEFSRIMIKRFEMSMMGELKFFLWISSQANEGRGIHISNQVCEGYAQEIVDMADAKPIKISMALNGHLDLNEEGK
jgi:hypothetical protein